MGRFVERASRRLTSNIARRPYADARQGRARRRHLMCAARLSRLLHGPDSHSIPQTPSTTRQRRCSLPKRSPSATTTTTTRLKSRKPPASTRAFLLYLAGYSTASLCISYAQHSPRYLSPSRVHRSHRHRFLVATVRRRSIAFSPMLSLVRSFHALKIDSQLRFPGSCIESLRTFDLHLSLLPLALASLAPRHGGRAARPGCRRARFRARRCSRRPLRAVAPAPRPLRHNRRLAIIGDRWTGRRVCPAAYSGYLTTAGKQGRVAAPEEGALGERRCGSDSEEGRRDGAGREEAAKALGERCVPANEHEASKRPADRTLLLTLDVPQPNSPAILTSIAQPAPISALART